MKKKGGKKEKTKRPKRRKGPSPPPGVEPVTAPADVGVVQDVGGARGQGPGAPTTAHPPGAKAYTPGEQPTQAIFGPQVGQGPTEASTAVVRQETPHATPVEPRQPTRVQPVPPGVERTGTPTATGATRAPAAQETILPGATVPGSEMMGVPGSGLPSPPGSETAAPGDMTQGFPPVPPGPIPSPPGAGEGPVSVPGTRKGEKVERKTKSLIFLIVLVMLISGFGICVVWLGLIRFGTPSVSQFTLAETIDSKTMKPRKKMDEFTGKEDKIYCTAKVKGFSSTRLGISWYMGDTEVGEFEDTYGDLANRGTTKFIASSGYIAFYMKRPKDGWVAGKYRVQLYLDGEKVAKKNFSIESERSYDGDKDKDGVDFSTYRDPEDRFSISYPSDWKQASESSLEENVLVGFVGPGTNGFNPKFVVLLSSQPMDIDALNAELTAQGATESELFHATTAGDNRALERTFEWDYQTEAGETFRLKSIQALVEGEETVYSIQCHALAKEFSGYEETFDEIINSFKVLGPGDGSSSPVPEGEVPVPTPVTPPESDSGV